ncbi:hypothetical protein [Micromonospora globbae]|uniref:hypothetical protein n=1 Tax=Micromonospora globbae TaxID=1894969 RepID=UPI0034281911
MDRHHDQTGHDPTRHDSTPRESDERLAGRLAIPGDARPTLWRTPPGQQPGCLSPQLARLLLDDRTQDGDVVLDIDDDVAFAATAAATGRRHHALGGEHHLAAMSHAAGYLDLILLHWPRPAVNPHWLLRACRSLLGATGCVVVAVSADPDQRVAHLGPLGGAAATAGLRTIGHVAVLAPDVLGAATPVAVTGTLGGRRGSQHPSRPGTRHDPDPVTHPHTDLLIFGVEAAGDE